MVSFEKPIEAAARNGRFAERNNLPVESFIKLKCPNAIQLRGRDHGQSLVELALTLPLLFLILFGTIDLGRAYFAYVTITNAAREGARYGMTDSTSSTYVSDITQRAVNENGGVISASNVDVKCAAPGSDPTDPTSYGSCTSTSPQPGGSVQVTVNCTFQFATLYIFGLSNIPISNYTRMAIIQ